MIWILKLEPDNDSLSIAKDNEVQFSQENTVELSFISTESSVRNKAFGASVIGGFVFDAQFNVL